MSIEEDVLSAIPEMLERVKRDQLKSVEQAFTRALTVQADAAATQFFKDELLPELQAQLQAQKGAIVKAAASAAEKIGQALAEALVLQATKSVGSTYTAQQISALLFKGY